MRLGGRGTVGLRDDSNNSEMAFVMNIEKESKAHLCTQVHIVSLEFSFQLHAGKLISRLH